MNIQNDRAIQLIRTAVQAIMTYLIARLAAWPLLHQIGVELSDDMENLLTNVAIVLYVAAVNALTTRWPVLEFLNGWLSKPSYSEPPAVGDQ